MQTGWDWGCCYCHRRAYILWKGCPPRGFHKPSWPLPEGKLLHYPSFDIVIVSCYFSWWLRRNNHFTSSGHLRAIQVLTAIGNFCICSIAVGMFVEIIVMYPIQHRAYRPGIDNLLVLLIGGIPIAMPTVLSVTMAIGSHRLAQQVCMSKSYMRVQTNLFWQCFWSVTVIVHVAKFVIGMKIFQANLFIHRLTRNKKKGVCIYWIYLERNQCWKHLIGLMELPR